MALDSTKLQSVDQYFLKEVDIVTATGSISIKSLLQELSIYEDIFKPAITGSVLIADAIGLINALKITGEEKIKIVYGKTTAVDLITATKEFRIIRIGERVRKNFNTELYSIHFCSDELVISESRRVSKSYRGKEISVIIQDILDNYLDLQSSGKNYLVTGTSGVYDFVIPSMKPLETINFLTPYARSTTNTNIFDYMFFEANDGFKFVSLEKLYQQIPYSSYSYSSQNYYAPSSNLGLIYGNNIKSYSFLDTFDTLYGLNTGSFANKVITIDPLTQRYYVDKFNYTEYFNQTKHLNDNPVLNNFNNNFSNAYDSTLKVLVTNRNQEKALGFSDKPGSVAKDAYIAERVKYRTAQIPLSQYTRMKLALPGDPGITVGKVIYIELPLLSENSKGGIDEYHSGNYLVTAVRQIIDTNMEYETILEVAKESFIKPSTKGE